jgi:hypothetical protein
VTPTPEQLADLIAELDAQHPPHAPRAGERDDLDGARVIRLDDDELAIVRWALKAAGAPHDASEAGR